MLDKKYFELIEERQMTIPENVKFIAVFGDSKKSGYEKLDQLLENIPISEIIHLQRNDIRYEVVLNNGNVYRVLPANEAARGYRYHKAYIHSKIDLRFIHDRIMYQLLTDDFEYFE
jgi:hypothetical protein